MIKLYGFAVSNYFNMVRMALEEKGAPFEIVTVYPGQEPETLARTPVGKVPYLETSRGFLSEASVMLEYIEQTQPGPGFLPEEPYARARVRQAMKMIELYVELPARRLYPGVFFGGSNADLTVQEVEPVLRRGVAGLARVLQCGKTVMGEELSLADFLATFSFPLAAAVARKVYDWDLMAEVPGLEGCVAALNARPTAQRINAQSQAEMPAFLQYIRARAG